MDTLKPRREHTKQQRTCSVLKKFIASVPDLSTRDNAGTKSNLDSWEKKVLTQVQPVFLGFWPWWACSVSSLSILGFKCFLFLFFLIITMETNQDFGNSFMIFIIIARNWRMANAVNPLPFKQIIFLTMLWNASDSMKDVPFFTLCPSKPTNSFFKT